MTLPHIKEALKHYHRIIIVATVIDEALCMWHLGWMHHDQVGAYLIGAAWLKESVRKFVLE